MTQYIITFHSGAEDMSIGVIGDSWMECLVALTEEFGDGVMPMFEGVRTQLEKTSSAVADAYREDIERLTLKHLRAAAERAGGSIETKVENDRPEQSGLDVFAVPDEFTDELEEMGAEKIDEPDDAFCAICAKVVSADVATASRIMTGQVRCTDCRA